MNNWLHKFMEKPDISDNTDKWDENLKNMPGGGPDKPDRFNSNANMSVLSGGAEYVFYVELTSYKVMLTYCTSSRFRQFRIVLLERNIFHKTFFQIRRVTEVILDQFNGSPSHETCCQKITGEIKGTIR